MSQLQQVQGTERTLPNGAVGATYRMRTKDGRDATVFRILRSTAAAAQAARDVRSNPRQITQAQARDAFKRYYARTRTIKRGPRKGTPRFASPRGRKAAGTYDANHSGKQVISDARYLHNPHAYDFQGVDSGALPRKRVTPSQAAVLAAGRARRTANVRAKAGQAGGYWW